MSMKSKLMNQRQVTGELQGKQNLDMGVVNLPTHDQANIIAKAYNLKLSGNGVVSESKKVNKDAVRSFKLFVSEKDGTQSPDIFNASLEQIQTKIDTLVMSRTANNQGFYPNPKLRFQNSEDVIQNLRLKNLTYSPYRQSQLNSLRRQLNQ